eukprot:scaffold3058_cov165-Ochromonas_danica.AAC.36
MSSGGYIDLAVKDEKAVVGGGRGYVTSSCAGWCAARQSRVHHEQGCQEGGGCYSRKPENRKTGNSKNEKDSCGVGLVANLHKISSRKIVLDANQMLVRMSHRGGCGCEPNSGDGAGILVGMPHSFYQKVVKEELGLDLGAPNTYGSGIIFTPHSEDLVNYMHELFASQASLYGFEVLGWRTLKTDNSTLGESSKSTEPRMEQVFIRNSRNLPWKAFDAELYRIRRMVESELLSNELLSSFYVCSLSSQTITYKGQLTPEQVFEYYHDLRSEDFASHMALVHSRFSTNTFPSWERAQPVRMMCHNGEINTLRGNKNWMYSRSGLMASPLFGEEFGGERLLPTSDQMSDSGNFDSVLELLAKASPRMLPECIMMMIPEAWQDNLHLSDSKRAFYEYNSCVMEPWDGPAMIAFTDGRYIGATLDRNGLRPSRYYVTKDDVVLLSSEIGVLPDLPESSIKTKSRLEPGKMFLVDFDKAAIISDNIIKEEIAGAKPYAKWLEDNLFTLEDWVNASKAKVPDFKFTETTQRLNSFGYTVETLDMLLYPMGVGGKEALGSMGNDAALAVMSKKPRLVFDYFKQLFAQVTNPPIDPIREEMVMSLICPVGPESVSNCELFKRGWRSSVIDCTIPITATAQDMEDEMAKICFAAAEAVQGSFGVSGAQAIVLSHRLAGPDRIAIPSLLVLGAVHQHLLRTKQRPQAALFVECGDAREVHDFSTLLGFGADGICPFMAYEALAEMNASGVITARSNQEFTNDELFYSYRKAAAKGILKVMSKMGISTLQSYKGAQVFEAIGLNDDVMERCFTGTSSRVKGAGFSAIFNDIAQLHREAYAPAATAQTPLLQNLGQFHLRNKGEAHLNTPEGMFTLQQASRTNSRDLFKQYTKHLNQVNSSVTLRGVLKLKVDKSKSIPLSEVEPAKDIVKRFNTGAMSLGSISQETHEALAIAMNTIGARSNTGEGGEDPKRFLDNRRSAIKQVASGRFGVTSHYLANSDQVQIKMAQGAKPGEGGELPGAKVTDYIAQNRMTTPGVGLISPPPHHDIYSIEDLAQLIHDLKNAQPTGEVSVKLVSEVGVGVVAAGVAKAKADHITISGGDGGTGAAAWTGIKGAGLPWELGLAEAQQTLVINNLRDRVRLQTDGQIKTGRDVVIAACLGAEEFGFATAPLITLGCIMMRKCHLNTCPVGIATQDPLLRKKFSGKPEYVINFFFLLAEEVREYMAELGVRSLDELVGRADLLEVDQQVLHEKNKGLDLSGLLTTSYELNPKSPLKKTTQQNHMLESALDQQIIADARPALEEGVPVTLEYPVTNLNRTVGTMLSYHISKKYGAAGLPEDTIQIKLHGHGGQSLGFALAKGVRIEVEGDSNDYVGKSLSGGCIAVYPEREALAGGFVAEENVIVGNVCLYGATSGRAFFRGKAGERFAVRNSGAIAVVEGCGDHGCEYMTGGRVVVLGETGRNFAAGMSGGVAYVYDRDNHFKDKCNMGMVGLERVEDGKERSSLRSYITEHLEKTGSTAAQKVLNDWENEVGNFVKVMPHDYKRVLLQLANKDASSTVISESTQVQQSASL